MKVVVELRHKNIELTEEEARRLYAELGRLFGGQTVYPDAPRRVYPYDDVHRIWC